MKNNKGYSLAELLVSIAIFSIVMISIVSVMRNVSISYRNENAEVDLQENAQILLTQVEELLVDCNSCDTSGAPSTYTITDVSGQNHVLKVENNQVKYSYAGSSFEVLADNVKRLKIDKNEDGDNLCIVKVDMERYVSGKSLPYTYEASKEVVFRNDVENAAYRDDAFLDTASPTGSTNPSNSNAIDVTLCRYQVLNLVAAYDIDPTTIVKTEDDDNYYSFVQPNSDFTSISYLSDGTTSAYLSTSSTGNKTTEVAYSCVITANKNNSTSTVTLNISTDKVELLKGSGVVYAPYKTSNDGAGKNFFSYVNVTGISLRDMYKYNSTLYNSKIKGGIKIKKGSTSKLSATNKPIFPNECAWTSNNSYNYGQLSLTSEPKEPGDNDTNLQCNVGLGFDEFSDDKLCVMFGNGLKPAYNVFDSGNYTIEIFLTYPWDTSTKTKSMVYTLYTNGSSLTNVN